MPTTPLIDVIVACHDPDRPLRRTLDSIVPQIRDLTGAHDRPSRVTVVCHNTTIEAMRTSLGGTIEPEVHFIELLDEIRGPATPMNYGIDSSDADWVSIVGSDDELADGALAHWLSRGLEHDAVAVIAPVSLDSYARRRSQVVLDPVRDHLATQWAPLGLLRRAHLEQIGFRFTPCVRVGEDMEPSLRLWFSGGTVVRGDRSPSYVVHDDFAGDRMTTRTGSFAAETSSVDRLLDQPWLDDLSVWERTEIATALGWAIYYSVEHRVLLPAGHPDRWNADDSAAIALLLAKLSRLAPLRRIPFSRRNSLLLRESMRSADADHLLALLRAADATRSGRRLTDRPLQNLMPLSPARLFLRGKEDQLRERGRHLRNRLRPGR